MLFVPIWGITIIRSGIADRLEDEVQRLASRARSEPGISAVPIIVRVTSPRPLQTLPEILADAHTQVIFHSVLIVMEPIRTQFVVTVVMNFKHGGFHWDSHRLLLAEA